MMTNVKLDILVKDRQSQLDAVQQIIDTADALQADLTADQAKSVEEHTKSVKDLDEKIRQARHDLFVLAEAKALAEEVGMRQAIGHPGTLTRTS